MLTAVQILSKVLATKDYGLIENNLLDESYFQGYEKEYNWMKDHYMEFHNVPDEVSFLNKFPDFDLVEVTETDRFLIDTIKEEHLYMKFTEVLPEAARLLKNNSNAASEFLMDALKNDLRPNYEISDTELVTTVDERVHNSEFIEQNIATKFIPTGFEEIDLDITGLQRGDELVVFFARINQGKSWVVHKICTNAVELGYNAGIFSPEMSVEQLGYRFDTLHGNVPNSSILFGKFNDDYSLDDYKQYAQELSRLDGRLYVTKPKDFQRKLTVSKLRNWIKLRKLDIVAIDGITYLSDERYKRGDSKTTTLTNISEDLMDLSSELNVPILVVVQANRGGIVDKDSTDTPELENIKDSDGIGANASKVYAIRQLKDKDGNTILLIENKKSRTGEVGQSYKYEWAINNGKFTYRPVIAVNSPDDIDEDPRPKRKKSTGGNVKKAKNVEDEF